MDATELKILLVDDHQMMREGVRRVLAEQPGFRVVAEAATGQTALDLMRAAAPDVVIMDLHLPGEDGIAITARIRSEFPGVRIVVLSADTDLATVQRALQIGVSGYIAKNGPPEELVRAIREAADQRVYLCREVASVVVQDYMKLVINRSAPLKPALSERERALLTLVAEGKRNKEIAEMLQIGVKSVETYRSRLMRKLNCASTAELTRYAIREGITTA
ncbi:MAG TPA: response regulator transcription factor [Verrucomicrobiae bacterium]